MEADDSSGAAVEDVVLWNRMNEDDDEDCSLLLLLLLFRDPSFAMTVCVCDDVDGLGRDGSKLVIMVVVAPPTVADVDGLLFE